MILPLVEFALACIVFGTVGAVILATSSTHRLSPFNLLVFLLGALPCSLVFGGAYGWVFADSNNELHSGIAVAGEFAAIIIGGTCGGLASLAVSRRLRRT